MSENSPRLDFLEYGIKMAFEASGRATCGRKFVGCAIFDSNRVVRATGYNGAPSGMSQCNDSKVGHDIVNGHCVRAIHAERNAVMFSNGIDLMDGYAFSTVRPCMDCFPLLVGRGLKYIYYLEEYRSEEFDQEQREVCKEKKVILERLDFDIVKLSQKVFDFHQGPGGLLVGRNRLTIEEHIPEMMDH